MTEGKGRNSRGECSCKWNFCDTHLLALGFLSWLKPCHPPTRDTWEVIGAFWLLHCLSINISLEGESALLQPHLWRRPNTNYTFCCVFSVPFSIPSAPFDSFSDISLLKENTPLGSYVKTFHLLCLKLLILQSCLFCFPLPQSILTLLRLDLQSS